MLLFNLFLLIFTFSTIYADQTGVVRAIACENVVLIMLCPYNYEMVIQNVTYGRSESNICTSNPSAIPIPNYPKCASPSSDTEIVYKVCNGYLGCQLWISDDIYGSPCQPKTLYNYIEVYFYCITPADPNKPLQENFLTTTPATTITTTTAGETITTTLPSTVTISTSTRPATTTTTIVVTTTTKKVESQWIIEMCMGSEYVWNIENADNSASFKFIDTNNGKHMISLENVNKKLYKASHNASCNSITTSARFEDLKSMSLAVNIEGPFKPWKLDSVKLFNPATNKLLEWTCPIQDTCWANEDYSTFNLKF